MRIAQKKEGKRVQCYILGENSEMEQMLLASGALRKKENTYELVSQESINKIVDLDHGDVPTKADYQQAKGEKAVKGQHIKVDEKNGAYFPYPAYHSTEEFNQHYRHIEGNTYEQIPAPVEYFQVGDSMADPFIQDLLRSGKLQYNPNDPEHAWNAHLWGDDLSIPVTGAVVVYDKNTLDIGLIRAEEFDRDYNHEFSVAQTDLQVAKDYQNFLDDHRLTSSEMERAQAEGKQSLIWMNEHNFTPDEWNKQISTMEPEHSAAAAVKQAVNYAQEHLDEQKRAVTFIMNEQSQVQTEKNGKCKTISVADLQTGTSENNIQLS